MATRKEHHWSSATTVIKLTGTDARLTVALRRDMPAYSMPLLHSHAGPLGTSVNLYAATGSAWVLSSFIRATAMTEMYFLGTGARPLACARTGGRVSLRAVWTFVRQPVVMDGFHPALNSAMTVTRDQGTGVAHHAYSSSGGHAQQTPIGSHGAGHFAVTALSRGQKSATTAIPGHTMGAVGGAKWSADGLADLAVASRFAATECARAPRPATTETG